MVMKLDRPNLIFCLLNQIRMLGKNHFPIEGLWHGTIQHLIKKALQISNPSKIVYDF